MADRTYVLKARAEGTEATRQRLIACATELFTTQSFDDITLDAIADGAATTVRTALRLFGSKEMLLAAVLGAQGTDAMGHARPHGVDAILDALYDFYERHGDTVIRWLGDEHRVPILREHLNGGRQNFRRWVAECFALTLAEQPSRTRRQFLDALVVALDVYSWKLTRRDFGLNRKAAQAVTRRIVVALTKGE